MTYYAANNQANPLTFPSYAPANLPQRHISGLVSLTGNGSQLQHQYDRQQLAANLAPPNMVPPPESAGDRSSTIVTVDGDVPGSEGTGRADTTMTSEQPSHSDPEKEKEYMGTVSGIGKTERRKNRPGHKFGAKKRSWVWNWFVQDSNQNNVSICDYCGKVLTRRSSDKGSPKKLIEHLKTHKLTKNSINPARAIAIEPAQNTYSSPQAYNTYAQSSTGAQLQQGHAPASRLDTGHQQPQQVQQPQRQVQQSPQMQQPQPQQVLHQDQRPPRDEVADLADLKAKIYRRANVMSGYSMEPAGLVSSSTPQAQAGSPQYTRRAHSPQIDTSPYSSSKFHRHLLNFLAENKLSIRLLKSQSFQQLIYDLRPESVGDLVELTGLFSSFVEVSRLDNGSDSQSALAEANAANTLAQELLKK